MDPQFAGIATPEDVVIIFKFMVHLENGSGSITLCIPYPSMEPIKKKLKYRFQGETTKVDHVWKKHIEKKIGDMAVDLRCTMGKANINGKELLQMKVDDVILMDQKINDPVIIEIENVPKFQGFPGTFNNKKAVKIHQLLDKE
jgi:flagellar motor switch protein FliM